MGLFDMFPYTNFHELNLDWWLNAMKNLEKKVADLETKITGLKEEILAETDEKIAAEKIAILAEVDTKLEKVKKDLTELIANSIDDAVAGINTNIDAVKSSIETLRTDMNTADTTLDGKITAVKADLESLENRVTTVEEDVSNTLTQIGTLQTDIDGLESSLTALAGRVTTAEASITGLQSSNTSILASLTTINSILTTVQKDITDLQTAVVNLSGQYDSLAAQINAMQEQIHQSTLQLNFTGSAEDFLKQNNIIYGNLNSGVYNPNVPAGTLFDSNSLKTVEQVGDYKIKARTIINIRFGSTAFSIGDDTLPDISFENCEFYSCTLPSSNNIIYKNCYFNNSAINTCNSLRNCFIYGVTSAILANTAYNTCMVLRNETQLTHKISEISASKYLDSGGASVLRCNNLANSVVTGVYNIFGIAEGANCVATNSDIYVSPANSRVDILLRGCRFYSNGTVNIAGNGTNNYSFITLGPNSAIYRNMATPTNTIFYICTVSSAVSNNVPTVAMEHCTYNWDSGSTPEPVESEIFTASVGSGQTYTTIEAALSASNKIYNNLFLTSNVTVSSQITSTARNKIVNIASSVPGTTRTISAPSAMNINYLQELNCSHDINISCARLNISDVPNATFEGLVTATQHITASYSHVLIKRINENIQELSADAGILEILGTPNNEGTFNPEFHTSGFGQFFLRGVHFRNVTKKSPTGPMLVVAYTKYFTNQLTSL